MTSSFDYQPGFQKVHTDARGNKTYYQYQLFDQPSEDAITNISAPEGVNVAILRDQFGKPRSITRSGAGVSATRSYVYDGNERLCKTIEPETGATVQDYDAANNVIWRATGLSLPSTGSCDSTSVAAAKKVTYGYDTLNRLKSTTYGDGSPGVTRDYTLDGLLKTVSSNGTVWTNDYNRRRLLVGETLNYGGVNYGIGRGYDANGFPSQLTYPDGLSIAYIPNALGEPRQSGAYATSIMYHPNGAVKSFTYGNGITHTLSQNARGLPEWSEDAGILKDQYGYDANGNVTMIADWQQGISNRGLSYDNLDRLASVNAPSMWGDAFYTYNALDNLTSTRITAGGTARTTTHTYDPATNLLQSVSNSAGPGFSFNYQYDSQGNIIQRGSQSYVFDMANRLTSPVGNSTRTYDGFGRMVSVVGTDGVNRVLVYSQSGQMLYATVTGNPLAAGTKYVYLHNHVVAEVGGGVQYDHTDGLGSPIAATDGARTVISRTRYEPYGQIQSGPAGTFGFTGHLNAADLGLVYMQQRYYDPVAGRFLSIDPITTDANTGGSFNRYAYANNSPYKYLDPDGRQVFPIQVGPPPPVGAPGRPLQNPDGSLPPSTPSGSTGQRPSFPIINPVGALITIPQALVAILTSGNSQPQSPVINPTDVAGKTPAEIGQVATGAGLVPKGPDPLGGRGAFVDPVTGEQRVLVHGDHAHVNDANGNRVDIHGNNVKPESPEAHLPIKPPPPPKT